MSKRKSHAISTLVIAITSFAGLNAHSLELFAHNQTQNSLTASADNLRKLSTKKTISRKGKFVKLNNERNGFTFENQEIRDLVLNIGDSYDEIIFGVGFPGITDIEVGPDGLIYVVSIGDGTIYRITPEAKKIDKEHDFECANIDKLSTDLSGCNLSNLE